MFKANNKKGQAILESLMALIIVIPLIFFLIRCLNQQINILLVDELIEERIICELTTSEKCEQKLSRKLDLIKPKIKDFKSHLTNDEIQITVTLQSGLKRVRSLNLKDYRHEF